MSAATSNQSTPQKDTTRRDVPLMQEGRLLENPLSEREMEVARLLSTGASNGEIAHTLIISPHTVKVHLRNIFEKLEVNSRTEASMLLVQRGWLTVPGIDIPQHSEPISSADAPEKGSEKTDAVAVALPPRPNPEPEPLLLAPPQLAGWQRVYLVGAIVLGALAFFLPSLQSRASASPSLLSDANQIGSPASEVLSLPRWQQLTALNEPLSRMALVYIDNQLLAIGGETTGGRLLQTVESYDFARNDWRLMAELPFPLSNSSAAVISNTIYVAGGLEAANENDPPRISSTLLSWRKGETSWTKVIDLPNPLAGSTLLADVNALYLIGGWDGQQMHGEIWRLVPNEVTNTLPSWQLLTRMDLPRAFLGATLVDRKLYIVGGSDGQHNLDALASFDLETGKWQSLAPLPTPRRSFSLVYDGSALYAMGGEELHPLPVHQRYDITTNEWTNFPSPIQGVWRNPGAVSSNGRIYMIGGWSGDYLNSMLEYQSSYRLLLPVISKDQ